MRSSLGLLNRIHSWHSIWSKQTCSFTCRFLVCMLAYLSILNMKKGLWKRKYRDWIKYSRHCGGSWPPSQTQPQTVWSYLRGILQSELRVLVRYSVLSRKLGLSVSRRGFFFNLDHRGNSRCEHNLLGTTLCSEYRLKIGYYQCFSLHWFHFWQWFWAAEMHFGL